MRDVNVYAWADLEYWTRRLASRGITPADVGGRAQILIGAAEFRYLGMGCKELSFSVITRAYDEVSQQADCYLAHAFNSNRLFAWLERKHFSTPHFPAQVEIEAHVPASFTGRSKDGAMFVARMAAERAPDREYQEVIKARIHLPGMGSRNKRCHFFAELRGLTRAYPWLPGDEVTIISSSSHAALQDLLDSGIEPYEWAIREDSFHARSTTVRVAVPQE